MFREVLLLSSGDVNQSKPSVSCSVFIGLFTLVSKLLGEPEKESTKMLNGSIGGEVRTPYCSASDCLN